MDRPSASPSATPRSSLPRDRDAAIHDPSIRLSTPVSSRLALGFVSSGTVGFVLGALHGGQTAQLRFRAEHAHKMPDTTTGWYLYHKSKNYHAMRGGISEGFRMAARTSLWTIMALGLESSVDRYRGCSDMFSTTVATLTVAGAFSLWHRFSMSSLSRTAKMGLYFGLVYGGMQDLAALARGRPIGYVEILRHRFGSVGGRPTSSRTGLDIDNQHLS
ncbi:hypothetical protein E4U24_003624 [Claviceps purpurea]|nr:hypothetical protein E4U11_003473 [Claviceps purpurea]KAG6211597.1 hypothetical protein E4U50_002150 [Claviceps purpurea]KAG6227298.1 hypothetical protein E4U34_005996 [Claviceps purpurea]KAG6257961.1 hypothetical protein E4U24_003624 [Claviceps purpurea]KAG6263242.1 hypothetical protein E4U49_002458 [Claviceps purpurea]